MKSSAVDRILLILIVIYVGWVSVDWAMIETRPPHWDMGVHLFNSLDYLNRFKDPLHFYRLWTTYSYYPPFRYWVTIPFYLLLGTSVVSAVISNLFFIILLAFSVYGIGETLWNSRVGLLAALFVLSSPVVASQFKEYQLDAPLAGMVALGFYLFLKADGFKNRKMSMWFGIATGLGMLTKWTFLFFFAFPLAEVVFTIWKSRNKEAFRNFWQAGLLGGMVASLWYSAHLPRLLRDLTSYTFYVGKSPDVLSVPGVCNYLKYLINDQLYVFPFSLFVIGIIFCLFRRGFAERNKYPLLMIAGTYVIFALIRNKDVRYTLPMLIAISILAVAWIVTIQTKIFRWILTGLLLTYEIAAFWIMSFGVSWVPNSLECNVLPGIQLVLFKPGGYLIGPPTHEQWHQEEIFRTIAADPNPLKDMVFKGLDTAWFNWGGTLTTGPFTASK